MPRQKTPASSIIGTSFQPGWKMVYNYIFGGFFAYIFFVLFFANDIK
jgi:hypothetical protein